MIVIAQATRHQPVGELDAFKRENFFSSNSGTEEKQGKAKTIVARTPSRASSSEVELHTRVAELERRLENQRTNINHRIASHNKGIRGHVRLLKEETERAPTHFESIKPMIADDNMKQVITNMLKPDTLTRRKAQKGPKLMKYIDADGNPVTERPAGSTGTGGAWLDVTTSDSDDDSDSEP